MLQILQTRNSKTVSEGIRVSQIFTTLTGKSLSEALIFAEHGENML